MHKKIILFVVFIVWLSAIACRSSGEQPTQPIPTLAVSPFSLNRTVYGFFPSPPEVSLQAVIDTYRAIGEHGDVVLLQQAVPWKDFVERSDGNSQVITDIHNQYILSHQNGLDVIFVVDPLNGLNRRQFAQLPFGWEASFANPKVRSAMENFTLRILREFKPHYLGLASEINTYADASPSDFEAYRSLYRELYQKIKAESPDTQVFVTFQWEDLNNLIAGGNEGRQAYQTNWDTVEAFEPELDLWVISTYPFIVYRSGRDIPSDYYTPLLTRTDKPLAVAEGGFTSQNVASFTGQPQDQVDYLNAIHSQIGSRMRFWIYLLLSDFNLDSYSRMLRQQGQGGDAQTLSVFSSVGLRAANGEAKSGMATWDDFRGQ